jgi:hypothetical protein
MGCHLESMRTFMLLQTATTLLLFSLSMLIFNADEMGGRLDHMGKLLCRFGKVLISIHTGTWMLNSFNSSSMAFTMAGTGIIAVFMLVASSFHPILIFLTTLSSLKKLLLDSCNMVSSPPQLDLLYILTSTMP